jgi:hypothetical protein
MDKIRYEIYRGFVYARRVETIEFGLFMATGIVGYLKGKELVSECVDDKRAFSMRAPDEAMELLTLRIREMIDMRLDEGRMGPWVKPSASNISFELPEEARQSLPVL